MWCRVWCPGSVLEGTRGREIGERGQDIIDSVLKAIENALRFKVESSSHDSIAPNQITRGSLGTADDNDEDGL